MNTINRTIRRFAVLFGIACVSGAVQAQDQSSDDQQQGDRLLEEVIVTAEFREVSVQDTPIAITAMTGDMLEARGFSNIYEMTALSPNVTLKPGGQARSGMMAYIRGIGQSDFIAALEPGVGIYVDDVYYAQLTGSLLELLDVERVEVLRGPQGTLAGRNSIGGAIKMYTKGPGDGGEYVRVGFGSFNEINVRGAADITLVEDSLWLRASAAGKTRDGYVDILDYGCSHPGSGFPVNAGANGCKLGTQGGKDYTTARLALKWLANDDVEVNVIGDYLHDTSEMAAGTLLYADRRAIEAAQSAPGVYINPTIPLQGADGTNKYYYDHIFVGYGRWANDPLRDPYVSYATLTDYNKQFVGTAPGAQVDVPWKPTVLPSRNYIDQWGVSAHVAWNINDTMSLTSITSYREYDTWMTWDEDGSPFGIWMLDNKLENWQFTQEFRFNGSAGPLDYTLGAFYLDQESTYLARVDLNHALIDFIHGPDPTPADTKAVFAHGVWNVSDRLALTAGVRYSDEYKAYTHFRHNPDGTDVGSKGPTFPGAPDLINIRLTGVNGLNAVFEDQRTDWRVAANWSANDDMMLYGSVATGYKGGGVNPRPFFPQQLQTFNSEDLTAYEVGFKSTLFDQLRFNAALFYTEYNDIQLILGQCENPFSPTGIGPPCLKPANVGDAEIKGVELEAHWYPTEHILVDAMYSKLDFKYTAVDPVALRGSSIDPFDMISPYTPEEKWSLGLQYMFPMTDFGALTVRADATYQGEVYADPTNNITNRIDSYTLTNLVAWWESPEGDWRLEFQCLNCTDEVYYHDLYDQSGSWGAVLAQPGMPRTYNFAIQRNFD